MSLLRVIKTQMVKWIKTEFFRPGILFWNLILPLTWGLQFYFLYIPFKFDNIDLQLLVIPNIAINLLGFTLSGQVCWMLFINASLFGGVFFMRERWEGTLEVLFLSPASRFGIVTGTALASSTNFLWFSIGLFLVIIMIQVNIQVASWLAVTISLFISFLVLLALGIFFQAFFIASRLGGMWATAIQEPLQFLSGLIFPIQYLPRIFQAVAISIPLTYVLLIVRGTLLGNLTLNDIIWELTLLMLMIVILSCLSVIFLKSVERHVKKHANLHLF